jgi:hypothetical protein
LFVFARGIANEGQPFVADVIGLLHEHGFRLVHVAGITSDSGEQLQADFLFRRHAVLGVEHVSRNERGNRCIDAC